MNKTELRALALDEKNRRRLVQRDYELPADGPVAPKVTVSAAVVADNPTRPNCTGRQKSRPTKMSCFRGSLPDNPPLHFRRRRFARSPSKCSIRMRGCTAILSNF
jgi:hypothetical protein